MNLSMSDLRELLCPSQASSPPASIEAKWRIVVLQRGWVVVGNVIQAGVRAHIGDGSGDGGGDGYGS